MAALQEKISATTKKTMSKSATGKSATGKSAKAEPAAAECIICCEPYNKSTRACIECEYVGCKYEVCIACVRAYLLTSTNEPHCMECKQPWTPKFMLALTKKWLTDTYRPHRQKFLCEVELSKLAESMEAAERYKLSKKEEEFRAELRVKERQLRHQLNELMTQTGASYARERNLARPAGTVEEALEKKVFFMSCPAAACNGMLSTQYKCGICELYTCPECHEVIGANKTAEHTCDPNNVASAQAIKKDTKQCPGCHNRIYRTEGCSQMWCTGCHTAFDWNTGKKVITGQLHNPHWLEYQRTQNNGQAQRAPGDVPCGGICTRNEFSRIIGRLNVNTHPRIPERETICEKLRIVYAFVVEVTLNRVRELRELCQRMRNFGNERVKYIVGEMTKEQLATNIFRSDRSRQKNTEILHIYELLSAVGIDLFNRLIVSELPAQELTLLAQEQIAEYDKLRIHCNGLFAAISNTYTLVVPQVPETWRIISDKFNTKTLSRIACAAAQDAAEKETAGAAAQEKETAGAAQDEAAQGAVGAAQQVLLL
jgi:hypothetical protein